MERLRKSDKDSGVERMLLTDEQKASIAETRNFYEAKLAQEDVLYQSKVAELVDPAEREVLQQRFRREREHLTTERDAKIEKIRSGES
jgi:hypothetical protein